MRNTLLILTFTISSIGSVLVNAETILKGYANEDIIYFDGEYRLQKGELFECTLSDNKNDCCFEEEIGTICVPVTKISDQSISKIDFFLDNVVYSDSNNVSRDSCKSGKSIKEGSDEFKWSYGFIVRSNEKTNDFVVVEASHVIKKNNMILYKPTLTKRWIGKINGQCSAINFTKSDIDEFLSEYHKINKHINAEHDLNIDVEFSLQLFSSRIESNYANNKINISTQIPADNSSTWPPSIVK